MRTGIDTMGASRWLKARHEVQQLAEVVLGDSAEYFLYRGKLYGEGAPGEYVSTLMGSIEGCEKLLRLIERLDAEEPLEAIIVDDKGREPDGPGRPVLKLLVGHLSHYWPHGRIEPI